MAAGDPPVIRHSSDPTRYGVPEGEQAGKMRHGVRATVLPAGYANLTDGRSRGFNATVAGTVIVDPDLADGHVVVDMRALDPRQLDQAVATSEFPHEAFYRLGTRTTPVSQDLGLAQAQSRINPLVAPNTYVVPATHTDGSFMPHQEFAVKPLPVAPVTPELLGAAPVYQQQPAPAPALPPQPMAPMTPVYDPRVDGLAQTMGGLQQGLQQIAQLLSAQQQTARPGVPLPATPPASDPSDPHFVRPLRARRVKDAGEDAPEPAKTSKPAPRRQTVEEYEESLEPEESGIIFGFESLEITSVTGPMAEKPKQHVIFEVPGLGRMSARYHEVIVTDEPVVLVYDTRYEEGQQFMLETYGADKPVRVIVFNPSEPGGDKKRKKQETYQAISAGLNYRFGVFDHTVLVRPDESSVDSSEDGDLPA